MREKVALVTGASRGVGKGIALGLCEAGATVYITGRTINAAAAPEGLGGSIHETAAEAEKLGGRCIAMKCDHTDDAQVEAVFTRISAETGNRLDILVNNVWGGYARMGEMVDGQFVFTWPKPFWEQPMWRWDAMFAAGVRAHFFASQLAARMMVPQRAGLIANISFWSAQRHLGNVPYGIAKAATDKMTADMAQELRAHNVAVVSLYPGLVRTESVMRAAAYMDMSNSESPQFIGRAVAALASDPAIMEKTGQVLVAAAVAQRYGFADIDGKSPRPLTLDEIK